VSPQPFRRRGGNRWNPQAPERVLPPEPIYEDGCYVISEAGESTTWAVCDDGRWGVVYECSGLPILAAWVDVHDLPLHVLAEALGGTER
jgi:hypothetical protein